MNDRIYTGAGHSSGGYVSKMETGDRFVFPGCLSVSCVRRNNPDGCRFMGFVSSALCGRSQEISHCIIGRCPFGDKDVAFLCNRSVAGRGQEEQRAGRTIRDPAE